MIRKWLGGALAMLSLCSCGDGDTHFEPWLLEELDPSEGLWIRTPEFAVASGEEVQDCYFFEVPDLDGGADLMVDRMTLALNPGSHHLNVFRVRSVLALDPAAGEPVALGGVQGRVVRGGECWKSGNWADWPLVTNSQESNLTDPVLAWQLPTNVATRFSPGETLMLQIHFVNATTQATPYLGRGGVNLYRSTDGDSMELGTMFATQQSIRICRSNPQPTYMGACALPEGSFTVAAANGHFHSRGRRFRMFSWDGITTEPPDEEALFYESDNWAEPDMALGMNLPLPPNGGVRWSCDFTWTEPSVGCAALDASDPQQANDCCYRFGPNVESSEHCNVFLYYYPRAEGDVACF
jgi:hypothetical protein